MKKEKKNKRDRDDCNDSVMAIKGQKVSSSSHHTMAPVPCAIYTRSGKLASYMLIVEEDEVRIMSKKKIKSAIPLNHCHPKIV